MSLFPKNAQIIMFSTKKIVPLQVKSYSYGKKEDSIHQPGDIPLCR